MPLTLVKQICGAMASEHVPLRRYDSLRLLCPARKTKHIALQAACFHRAFPLACIHEPHTFLSPLSFTD